MQRLSSQSKDDLSVKRRSGANSQVSVQGKNTDDTIMDTKGDCAGEQVCLKCYV